MEKFLKFLGVGENLLVETELIEHNISLHTLQLLGFFNQFLGKPHVREQFEHFKKRRKKGATEIRTPNVIQQGKQSSKNDSCTSICKNQSNKAACVVGCCG